MKNYKGHYIGNFVYSSPGYSTIHRIIFVKNYVDVYDRRIMRIMRIEKSQDIWTNKI